MTLETKRIIIGSLGGVFPSLARLRPVAGDDSPRRRGRPAPGSGSSRRPVPSPASNAIGKRNPGIIDTLARQQPMPRRASAASSAIERQRQIPTVTTTTVSGSRRWSRPGIAPPAILTKRRSSRAAITPPPATSSLPWTTSWPRRSRASTQPFNPHSPTPGRPMEPVNGLASAFLGCQQCHGSKVALRATDGGTITLDDLRPDEGRHPDQRRRPRPHPAQRRRPAPARPGQLAQHGYRPPQPGRLARFPAAPVTAATTSRRGAPANPRTAASAISGPTIPRRKSTKSRNTASPTGT